MIQEHPHRDTIEDFRRRRLAGPELLELDDHLRDCPSCREAVRDQATAVRASRQALESLDGDHLSFEELSRFVDRLADAEERAAVESHLEGCAMCRAELDDLAAMVEGPSVPLRRPRSYALAAVVAAAVATVIVGGTALLRIAGELEPAAPGEMTVRRTDPDVRPTARPEVPSVKTAVVPPAPHVAPVPDPTPTPGAEAGRKVDPFAKLPPSLRRVAEAIERGTLRSVILVAGLQGSAGSQRSAEEMGDAAAVIEPFGEVIEDDRPTFRWSRASVAEQARVQVFDGEFNQVLESAAVTGTSWKSTMRLARGNTYQWQVVLRSPAGEMTVPKAPDPPARFRILGARALVELNEARRAGAKLEAGLICMREGLFQEGARHLAAAAEGHPGSPVATLAARARRIAAAHPATG